VPAMLITKGLSPMELVRGFCLPRSNARFYRFVGSFWRGATSSYAWGPRPASPYSPSAPCQLLLAAARALCSSLYYRLSSDLGARVRWPPGSPAAHWGLGLGLDGRDNGAGLPRGGGFHRIFTNETRPPFFSLLCTSCAHVSWGASRTSQSSQGDRSLLSGEALLTGVTLQEHTRGYMPHHFSEERPLKGVPPPTLPSVDPYYGTRVPQTRRSSCWACTPGPCCPHRGLCRTLLPTPPRASQEHGNQAPGT
jgi:hypothetical protein